MNTSDKRATYIESIPVTPGKDMILTRLGYKKTKTVLSDIDIIMIENAINVGFSLCNPKGAFIRLKIIKNDMEQIILEDDSVIKSKSLCKLLTKSDEILLMASTVGSEVTQKISDEIKNGDIALGVVIDAVASEYADCGLDYIIEFVNKMVRREGKRLTKSRYSPGYGDLPLSNQKIIFDILNLDKLELMLTDRFVLVPEKSVIAIAGIERIEVSE